VLSVLADVFAIAEIDLANQNFVLYFGQVKRKGGNICCMASFLDKIKLSLLHAMDFHKRVSCEVRTSPKHKNKAIPVTGRGGL
jgi:hypothetical protein